MTLAFSNRALSHSSFPSLAEKRSLSSKKRNSKNLSLVVPNGCGLNDATGGPCPKTPMTSIAQRFTDVQLSEDDVSPCKKSSYESGPACVLPYLFLGCEKNAQDKEMLVANNIHYILNVAKETHSPYINGIASPTTPSIVSHTIQLDMDHKPSETSSRTLRYKNLAWGHNEENILASLHDAFSFIDEARSKKLGILVHCQLGVSRSASLIIAYVMRAQRLGVNEAYDYVKSRSGSISPNMSLICQLVELEKSLQLAPSGKKESSDSVHFQQMQPDRKKSALCI
ncbi:phosphatases II [Basidiobolus meristosporus CBS 931.73]|uniref:protein-tyrosine-phosphatase n=1 Tax=Basidiobolus meristosporus CBS 931.73 TaxID=1314790 RepID=A0A1Y1YBL3_9FUNG|nr:phosphatases II [Basidiobolus meristosporus CBS 931.73]|eukprot:ORX95342.1 phosphatases II [Basidiobolus meristosporus CBS 931.73]